MILVLILIVYARLMKFLHKFGIHNYSDIKTEEEFPWGNHPYKKVIKHKKCNICGRTKQN